MIRPWTRPRIQKSSTTDNISLITARKLYYEMSLIRNVEREIENLYHLDEMKTPVHLYIGQEAIATGVCSALRKDDYVWSNHRSHGHYLAKGGDLNSMISELYCRETGCSRGYGGSMHLVDDSVGFLGSSAIVGGGIPIGVGAALSSKLNGDDRVSVIFFGDGAADEGVLYESINFALLRKLPVIFVCENNFYAVCSPTSNRHSFESIAERFAGLGMPYYTMDGTDVVSIYQLANKLVESARLGEGPAFIECRAYRWCGHSGAGSDENLGYRSKEELMQWQDLCPLKLYEKKLMELGLMDSEQIQTINMEINDKVKRAFLCAQNSPLPDGTGMEKWLFSEKGE